MERKYLQVDNPKVAISRAEGDLAPSEIITRIGKAKSVAMSQTGTGAAGFSRAKSVRARSVQSAAPPVIPAKTLRRIAAKEAESQDSIGVKEIEAGEIWDFWALKINSCITDTHHDQICALEKISDVLFGGPNLNEMQKKELEKQEKERSARLEKLRRSQRKALDAARAVVFGPPPTQDQIDEEIRRLEEEELQSAQLDRLKERFEGTLTLL
jgi:hypothetical protein